MKSRIKEMSNSSQQGVKLFDFKAASCFFIAYFYSIVPKSTGISLWLMGVDLLLSTRNLITYSTQQRQPLRINNLALIFRVRVEHLQPVAFRNPAHAPCLSFTRLLEELLVVVEAPATSLGEVKPRPQPGDSVGGREYEEYEVRQVVEHDGCQECDCEVGDAPDNDGDGGSLGARGGGEDFSGNQPDCCEPADAKGASCDE